MTSSTPTSTATAAMPFGPVEWNEEHAHEGAWVTIPVTVHEPNTTRHWIERRTTTVWRVLNGGTLIEVHNPLALPGDHFATVRVPGEDVVVIDTATDLP